MAEIAANSERAGAKWLKNIQKIAKLCSEYPKTALGVNCKLIRRKKLKDHKKCVQKPQIIATY